MFKDVTEDIVLTKDFKPIKLKEVLEKGLDFILEKEENKYRVIGRKNSFLLDGLLSNTEPLA